MSTPPELIGTAAAPWREWCREKGLHPVDVLLEVQRVYGVRVPSHPDRAPLRLRHVDERVDELRPLILEVVDELQRFRGSGRPTDETVRTQPNARPHRVRGDQGTGVQEVHNLG